MDDKTFFSYYIPALKKALFEEKENKLKEPEEYIDDPQIAESIMWYVEENGNDTFLDRVGYYYDAQYNNFEYIKDIRTEEFKQDILKYIPILEKLLGINKE